MVKVNFVHSVKTMTIVNDKPIIHEEYIIDGAKGIFIKYYHKENDIIEKIIIKGDNDKFNVKMLLGDKKEEKVIDKKELIQLIKSTKLLVFAKPYASAQLKRSK